MKEVALSDFAKRFVNVLDNLRDNDGSHITSYKLDKNYKVASQAQLSHIKRGRNEPTNTIIEKLQDSFPNINKAYIYLGEEPMFLDNGTKVKQGDILSHEDFKKYVVPLIPLSSTGLSLSECYMENEMKNVERVISPVSNIDFAVTVTGDAMAPELPNGTRILIKKIDENAFIDWGRTYVLDTINGIVIKDLFPAVDDSGYEKERVVICRSVNPAYPDFEIDMKSGAVFGVYRVLLSLSQK